ncbi:ketosynthase chain-length factor [Actinomadura rugatobispora]|uniref:Beta-ketoacyl synthase N-terminal-like domain-containing protein n=1 Tax=Actinomadura rugatobispora TaxID=1994 RepID=A0ABW1A9U1_9ACTN|nr:ketosynthase chain-length factor [Actinomadura rugatobispora]
MTARAPVAGACEDHAVVTGLGIASPSGLGTRRHWAGTLAGHVAIGPITRFDASGYPVRLAGEVPGFDPREHLPGRLLPQTDHLTRLALAAADWAMEDSGLSPSPEESLRYGVITANSAGGFEFGENELRKLWSIGPEKVSAYQSFAWFYAVNTGQISIRHGLRGPSGVLVSGQAGGLDAIGQARRALRRGADGVLTGGFEAPVCSWGVTAQLALPHLSTGDDPATAYLPFAAGAAGYVIGEGGAVLVLEREDRARARGARRRYGRVAGYAATLDPPPGSGRPSTLRTAAALALADAGVEPDGIDVVFADAAGTPALDRVEAEAIAGLFGDRGVPVTAPKAMTGRLSAGGAAVDVATCLLAMRDGIVPPTAGVRPDPAYRIDLVTGRPRPARIDRALILARGEGGFNSALVLTRPCPVHGAAHPSPAPRPARALRSAETARPAEVTRPDAATRPVGPPGAATAPHPSTTPRPSTLPRIARNRPKEAR